MTEPTPDLDFAGLYALGKDVQRISFTLEGIMATIQQLNTKVDELQAALDTEQAQIAEAIAQLTVAVEDLTAQVADGGTEAERQALLDKLVAVKADLENTVVPPTPEPEG